MQTSTYLYFNGRCEEAFKFYEQLLGGKITAMIRAGDTPAAEELSADWGDKIMHAYLTLGDQALMASDAPPDHYQAPAGFSVQLSVEKPADAKRIFSALAEGGRVTMPLQKTFWSEHFGMLVDRFGIPWMINHAPAT